MIATIVNCLAVIVGSLIGFGLRSHIKNEYETVVYDGAGI
ncbi:MAG TPA: DUF554 family protein, partial [Candidatus Hydrothermia bacterium]|nr:DUF554 family protein [Candidatus Hydrothermia bacterium]